MFKTMLNLPVNLIFVASGETDDVINSSLSEKGKKQVWRNRCKIQNILRESGRGTEILWMSSSAQCAIETGEIFFGNRGRVVLPELDFSTNDAFPEDLNTLGTYIEQGKAGSLLSYGVRAVRAILAKFEEKFWLKYVDPKFGSVYIAVIGNAALLNMITLLLCPKYTEALHQISLKAGDVFVINETMLLHYGTEVKRY